MHSVFAKPLKKKVGSSVVEMTSQSTAADCTDNRKCSVWSHVWKLQNSIVSQTVTTQLLSPGLKVDLFKVICVVTK